MCVRRTHSWQWGWSCQSGQLLDFRNLVPSTCTRQHQSAWQTSAWRYRACRWSAPPEGWMTGVKTELKSDRDCSKETTKCCSVFIKCVRSVISYIFSELKRRLRVSIGLTFHRYGVPLFDRTGAVQVKGGFLRGIWTNANRHGTREHSFSGYISLLHCRTMHSRRNAFPVPPNQISFPNAISITLRTSHRFLSLEMDISASFGFYPTVNSCVRSY